MRSKSKATLIFSIFVTFLKLGSFSFGSGYAMIPLIEREVVDNRKLIEWEKIVDVFGLAEALPGAIALNSSAFVGYSSAECGDYRGKCRSVGFGYNLAGLEGVIAAFLEVALPCAI